MQILYIFNRVEIGGATKAMLNTITNLDSNLKPIVISPNKNGYVQKICSQNNIEFHYIKYFEIGYAFNDFNYQKLLKFLLLPILLILNRLFNYMGYIKLKKEKDFANIKYIHTNTNRDDFGLYLSKKTQIPHILHLREFDKDFFNIIYLKHNIYNYFNKNIFKFIAISNSIKEYYEKKGIPNKKIEVIYDGLELETIPLKNSENFEFKILMLSNIAENKGQRQLIDAINLLDNNLKSKITVDFFGTGSSTYINKLKKIIKNYHLNNTFRFMGYQNKVYEKISKYDIGITASKAEGFGLVTIEYMSAGLCPIVSNTGANLEIIKNGYNGLVYEYNNIADFSKQIKSILTNKAKYQKICHNAIISSKKYSIANNVNNLKKIYMEAKNEN